MTLSYSKSSPFCLYVCLYVSLILSLSLSLCPQGGIRVIMTLDEDMMSGFMDKTVERLRVGVTGPEAGAYVEDAVALRGIVVIDDKKDDHQIDWTKEFDGDVQNEEIPKEKR